MNKCLSIDNTRKIKSLRENLAGHLRYPIRYIFDCSSEGITRNPTSDIDCSIYIERPSLWYAATAFIVRSLLLVGYFWRLSIFLGTKTSS